MACGDLVPQPRIESQLPALGAQNLSNWTTREVPKVVFYVRSCCSVFIVLKSEIYFTLMIVQMVHDYCNKNT